MVPPVLRMRTLGSEVSFPVIHSSAEALWEKTVVAARAVAERKEERIMIAAMSLVS